MKTRQIFITTAIIGITSLFSINSSYGYPWLSPYSYCGNNPVNRIDPDGRDWIEDEDGNVSWYKNINKDNVPKGYKYIGTEYMGISIIAFKPYSTESNTNHLVIDIGYSEPNSKESSYNWIQTVERDGNGKQIVDYDSKSKEGQANYPYYQDKDENEISKDKNGYNITYHDEPSEIHTNGSFDAELSLIGDPLGIQRVNQTFAPNSGVSGKGIYAPKFTLRYGFSVKNGIMTVNPISVVKPSSFHRQTINKIK